MRSNNSINFFRKSESVLSLHSSQILSSIVVTKCASVLVKDNNLQSKNGVIIYAKNGGHDKIEKLALSDFIMAARASHFVLALQCFRHI